MPLTPTDPQAERRELFRLAGVNALARSRNGRDLSPEARADAQRWAATAPLGRPLSSGEPTPAHTAHTATGARA
jgi:hypothetical protein